MKINHNRCRSREGLPDNHYYNDMAQLHMTPFMTDRSKQDQVLFTLYSFGQCLPDILTHVLRHNQTHEGTWRNMITFESMVHRFILFFFFRIRYLMPCNMNSSEQQVKGMELENSIPFQQTRAQDYLRSTFYRQQDVRGRT